MVDFEEMKERHPRGMIIVQGLVMTIVSTIIALILISPIYFFNISGQQLFDVFTFPPEIIPSPFNLTGILLLPVGLLFMVWANYTLLQIGKIGLRAREPMQTPATLVISGPYRYSRNPLYLGGLIALFGLVVVWSSLVVFLCVILVYIIFRYVFIRKEELILENEFGDEYRTFKKHVRRWF